MLGQSISKNSLILGAFALVTAGTLALTNLGTQDRIAAAERGAQQKALFEVVPIDQHDNDMLSDTMAVPAEAMAALGLRSNKPIYIARQQGSISALIIPATAHDGYSGDIDMIVGVTAAGTIAGVRVLRHQETPGLGDKVDVKKSQWILTFKGKSLSFPVIEDWKVKKDGGEFDQFAGATITPRAMVGQIKRVLEVVAAQPSVFFPGSAKTVTTADDTNATSTDTTLNPSDAETEAHE
jgi:Na+-translocating ferredoxin:NAD+ oxidoreductase subunit G